MSYIYTLTVLILLGFWASISAQSENILSIAWSGDGKFIAIGIDRTVTITDASTSAIVTTFSTEDTIQYLAWSNLDYKLAVGVSRETVIWDVVNEREVARISVYDRGLISHLQWSPDDRSLLINLFARAFIWDLDGNQLKLMLQQDLGPMTKAIWSPDGSRIATVGYDSQVLYWDVNSGELLGGITIPRANVNFPIEDIAFSPDGQFIAMATATDGQLRLLKVQEDRLQFSDEFRISQTEPSEIEWSMDGTLIVQREGRRTIRVWDVINKEELETITLDTDVTAIAYSPFGGRLALGQLSVDTPVKFVVPAPSLQRIEAIQQRCEKTQGRVTPPKAKGELQNYIAQIRSQRPDVIPAACAADLIAVAEAVLAEE